MSNIYSSVYNTKVTPQSEPIPGKDMVANSAGGFSFALDCWKQLDRFLILGSEGGTYYIGERKLTLDNAKNVEKCIKENGPRTVHRIVEVSDAGRAPKNDPALFALAMCAKLGDEQTRRAAYAALPQVARIGTHLFHFMEYADGLGGWGRGMKRAITDWYTNRSVSDLAYQMAKYQGRDGWTHRDALRLAHIKPQSAVVNDLFKWSVKGGPLETNILDYPELTIVHGYEAAKTAKDEKEIISLIGNFGLTREMIPTEFLNKPAVQEALLEKMPMTALIRNLGNMSKSGLLVAENFAVVGKVVDKITDAEALRKARVHPLTILIAEKTYASGRGLRGSGEWTVVPKVVDALNDAFYLAFKNVEPTGQRIMLAIDISGSMDGSMIAGTALTAREGAAAMALVTEKVEPNVVITTFSYDTVSRGYGWGNRQSLDGIQTADISHKSRLDQVCHQMASLPMSGTDCALPMLWASAHKAQIDTFIVYTDSETWAGSIHPVQALKKYRNETGIPAKLIVVGMTSNEFSIADPTDAGMLDVVGFDSAVPEVMRAFMLGEA